MANTTYDSIFDRFLSKITDYDLAELTDSDLENQLLKYLKSAISDFKYSTKDLSNRDDNNMVFNIELTDMEQEILAKFMLVHWINPYVYREENLRNIIAPKDYHVFSPANLLDKLKAIRDDMISEANSDMIYYYYAT